jgi:hypothetical protein
MRITTTLCMLLAVVAMLSVGAMAQQPATGQPAATQTKPADTPQVGPYTITSSIEFGVRGVSVRGDADKYRSDLNYQPGFRVFDSSFLMEAKENTGQLFDHLLVNSSGWGGDPEGYLRINAEKTKWYRFDADVRQLDYFNSLRNLALNQHIYNTTYKLGDFDLQILPASHRLRFNVGYSYDRSNGPVLTTYDYQRDEFPVDADYRTEANNFRAGLDAKLWVFDLSFLQGWRFSKDDTTYFINTAQLGNNPTPTSSLDTFRRDLPMRTRTPFTRLSLHTFLKRRVDFTGRFIYTSATSRFNLLETETGLDASGNRIVLDQWTAHGDVKRPNGMGDLGLTVLVTDRLRISETFRVNSFHIDGGNELAEALFRTRVLQGSVITLPPLLTDALSFNRISLRRFVNTIEGDYQFGPRLAVHLGYRYTDRRIETLGFNGPAEFQPETDSFTNHTNSVIAGFKARPLPKWAVYFDIEKGENDNVFTRVSPYDFTNVRLRNRITPTNNLSINLSIVTRDNTNPTNIAAVNDPTLIPGIPAGEFGADVNTRIYTASVDWTPNERLTLSSGYTHTHLTSEAAILLFINNAQQPGTSRYFVRDNFGFINAFVQLHPRVGFFAGYFIHNDPGQGSRVSTSPNLIISSYPMQFQSPETRLVFKLHDRLDWNVGYQFFDFKEQFVNNQFYHAHLPYTSLRFYFGRNR